MLFFRLKNIILRRKPLKVATNSIRIPVYRGRVSNSDGIARGSVSGQSSVLVRELLINPKFFFQLLISNWKQFHDFLLKILLIHNETDFNLAFKLTSDD